RVRAWRAGCCYLAVRRAGQAGVRLPVAHGRLARALHHPPRCTPRRCRRSRPVAPTSLEHTPKSSEVQAAHAFSEAHGTRKRAGRGVFCRAGHAGEVSAYRGLIRTSIPVAIVAWNTFAVTARRSGLT